MSLDDYTKKDADLVTIHSVIYGKNKKIRRRCSICGRRKSSELKTIMCCGVPMK